MGDHCLRDNILRKAQYKERPDAHERQWSLTVVAPLLMEVLSWEYSVREASGAGSVEYREWVLNDFAARLRACR